MQKMQNHQRRQEDTTTSSHSLMTPEVPLQPTENDRRASPLPAQASSVIPSAHATPGAGGVKKKKPKKKK